MRLSAKILLVLWVAAAAALAQPRRSQEIRPIPPPGIEVPERVREQLTAGLQRLDAAIEKLGQNELLADVVVYQKAVRYALDYNEFFQPEEFAKARGLLRTGEQRAAQLARGQAPWTTATGLVVRGYISKIDGSAQPFGLVIPESYRPDSPHRWRLDAWFHGRGETLSEVNFIAGREQDIGEFAPPDTIMLHL
jgi:hypothetical protein